ncbi:prephenate dehydrogenase [Corynebacterium sp. NPDC060344]|uniref:prephenate dehydrogenase n=1 Tax=Corynebacterium sp. NPDC060344 TaxID=3347101 RepID=UPI00364E5DAD
MTNDTLATPTCILGLGLIGGSLMRDLAGAGAPVYGWNRSAATADAAAAEGFDASTDLAAVLRRAQEDRALLVIGVPMFAVGGLLDQIAEHAPDCGITDVVSVKRAILDEVTARGMGDRYVGAHPMAGSEESGWDATRTGLYDGAAWVVCFDRAAEARRGGAEVPEEWTRTFRDVVALGKFVRSEVIPATADNHDRAVARISHMPHLLAYALAVVGDDGGPLTLSLAAGSFRDGTRVAGAEPDMVMSWCENNVGPVTDALDEAIALLTAARDDLRDTGTASTLADAGFRAHGRHRARSGSRTLDGGVTLSLRPIIRVSPGAGEWVRELEQAEGLGGRIEIF